MASGVNQGSLVGKKWYKSVLFLSLTPFLAFMVLRWSFQLIARFQQSWEFGIQGLLIAAGVAIFCLMIVPVADWLLVPPSLRRSVEVTGSEGVLTVRLGLQSFQQAWQLNHDSTIRPNRNYYGFLHLGDDALALYTGYKKEPEPVVRIPYSDITSVEERMVDCLRERGPGMVFHTVRGDLELSFGRLNWRGLRHVSPAQARHLSSEIRGQIERRRRISSTQDEK